METVDILAKIIERQQKEIDRLQKESDTWEHQYLELYQEFSEAKSKTIPDLEDQLAEALERIEELEAEKQEGITARDCQVCSQDTYEQQQNYERIKEQLYKENEELRARAKDDWGTWRDKALQLEKELKDARKDISFLEACEKAVRTLIEAEEQKTKSLEKVIVKLRGRIDFLEPKAYEYDKIKYNEASFKIGMEQGGRARR